MKKTKKTIIKRGRGRPRINYSYSEAKAMIRSEGLSSKYDYDKWWKYNMPSRIPKRPDTAYKNENFSWFDFLGSKNKFPMTRISYLSYQDAKSFAQQLGFRNKVEWLQFAKSDKKPENIPSRPDVIYRKTLEWNTWREFLGYDLHKKHEQLIISKQNILYIIKLKNKPYNVYKFGSGIDVKNKLLELQNNNTIRIVKMFNLPTINENWMEKIEHLLSDYFYGEEMEFVVENIAILISNLDHHYTSVVL